MMLLTHPTPPPSRPNTEGHTADTRVATGQGKDLVMMRWGGNAPGKALSGLLSGWSLQLSLDRDSAGRDRSAGRET